MRQGELPNIFALTYAEQQDCDGDTLQASTVADLMRGLTSTWGSWRHVRHVEMLSKESNWLHSRLSLADCQAVMRECDFWLGEN